MGTTQDEVRGRLFSERDISEGFDRLIAANRLFGAELNPTTIKKSGKGTLFLFRKLPSRHRMLSLWQDIFSHNISPEALLVEFHRYERLFHELGFHLVRLNAALSVGKYYWAKEGFDCSDRGQFQKMQDRLWALVQKLSLPVTEEEVRRLAHMSDMAAFRRDLKVPVWRDTEGYYTLEHDTAHPEEFLFPLGKAFLLCANPWDGYKMI